MDDQALFEGSVVFRDEDDPTKRQKQHLSDVLRGLCSDSAQCENTVGPPTTVSVPEVVNTPHSTN